MRRRTSGSVWGSIGCACLLGIGLWLSGCSDEPGEQESEVVVKTDSELAWAQYVANVEFAEGYEATCRPTGASLPRVLVTGFGRFLSNRENATGRIVSELVPGLDYPLTEPPPAGQIDPPAPQTRVAQGVIEVPGAGQVEVCGMVLPVFWDLASVLVLREAQSFAPDFVLMDGIAGDRQPLWLELGSVNAAMALPDGSGILMPVEEGAELIAGLGPEDYARGLLLSWSEVRASVEQRLAGLATVTDSEGVPFGDLVEGVRFAGYPRSSNTYLCNNTTYVVNYVLDHPGETFRLLEPSMPRPGGPTGVDVTLTTDLTASARVFVHWPRRIDGEHVALGAELMATLVGAQLAAANAPTRGDPAMADADD